MRAHYTLYSGLWKIKTAMYYSTFALRFFQCILQNVALCIFKLYDYQNNAHRNKN